MAILGPPGSGNWFYGKPLAECLGFTVVTVSSVLRKSSLIDPNLLDSGNLVDCQKVCDVLLDFISQPKGTDRQVLASPKSKSSTASPPTAKKTSSTQKGTGEGGVIVDGFPRTSLQIALMEQQWPKELQIQAAIHVDVPDSVCEAKMLGRRVCSVCHRSFNVATVDWDEFDLPAIVPNAQGKQDQECIRHFGKVCEPILLEFPDLSSSMNHQEPGTNDSAGLPWWTQRKDDSDAEIVMGRLRIHREHAETILQHYRQRGKLFTYTPKHGVRDIPDMQRALKLWWSQLA